MASDRDMIIATAGHIDHGKTSLVRALTGVDTDRLKEEKARGISIELGFAYAPVNGGAPLGIIDVPGHERLIHTMVAGASGIDFALLVVAADDGVMPQTREHLDILELLGIRRGAVALTKIDRVDEARLTGARMEIRALLARTGLAEAPIFAVKATDPENAGICALRSHLQAVAVSSGESCDQRLFRLAVDRVFTLSGQGTIVTGTLFSGAIRTGDTVHVMPSGRAARVRSLHAQNQPAASGRMGQRCALNLAGVTLEEVHRGDWLADPRALAPTVRMDVDLTLLSPSIREPPVTLTAWTPVHVHHGTAHQLGHVVPLQARAITCGASALAQLVFEKPLCATPGDRFILRNAQATRTIGGGRVLDPSAPARRRRSAERLSWLSALQAFVTGSGTTALLKSAPAGIELADLLRLTGRAPEHLDLPPEAITVEARGRRFVIDRLHWERLADRAINALAQFHERAPDEPGPDASRLRRIAAPEISEALWQGRLEGLLSEGRLTRKGAWLSLPQHVVVLCEEDEQLLSRLQEIINAGGFDPPWVRDLADAVQHPEPRVRDLLRRSASLGRLYQVVPDLFYGEERLEQLAGILEGLARAQGGAVRAASFRDAVGLGRKRTIQILEFFDRVGYTRRLHDAHVPRRPGPWIR
ncbi:MAG TPA: selenocysteine-specific translation elongation factor [Steroidobacteraceae bacterium]|nr:selenocysteine-specific translation elongation factor [Steroidobacteraceae bacterium]